MNLQDLTDKQLIAYIKELEKGCGYMDYRKAMQEVFRRYCRMVKNNGQLSMLDMKQ